MHISNSNLFLAALGAIALTACSNSETKIDREALVNRNNPHVTEIDTLSSLTVGNGEFAFTVDVTGLQTFPEMYRNGVPLGTQAQWGWHSFPNTEHFTTEETLKDYDFGRGRQEPYAVQFNEPGRQHDAANYFRVNPHRLHLGAIGFADLKPEEITDVDQTLDMWNGEIVSHFAVDGTPVEVKTYCHPDKDMVAADITSTKRLPVVFRMPYPTGGHADDACDWTKDDMHITEIVNQGDGFATLRHTLDSTTYYINVAWENAGNPQMTGRNAFTLTPEADNWNFTAQFLSNAPEDANPSAQATAEAASDYWQKFWKEGGVVDFSHATDPRAKELERRVVLSQYLLATQCAGSTPPQETGLTYNSWFGKFHLEMIWWHQAQFALYGHEDLLARTLPWYDSVKDVAKEIATRQGFDGLRWMKMTDPSGTEAPSKVGSFLIWQQPHLIYLAELLYRANPTDSVLNQYYDLVQQTADFMASFAEYDGLGNRYILRGAIPAQETLRAAETVNPPFELSYWHFALNTAQKWRERKGEGRNLDWDEIIDKLSPLAEKDGLYLAAETAPETYEDVRFTSDHMAVLAALGVLPKSPLVRTDLMDNTFDWIYDNWNWGRTWGWDYPTTAMNAVRLGHPEKAINALLMDKRTNTYLPNGHNYQDKRLRCYLPGNGGLLTAVALMTAGWDGCEEKNPGFPKDGTWDVRWEGIKPLP
ncbi:MAG: glycoside hydrolase family 65 [Lachnoclostridium sp.]|nr:glycoside hydrolase family 65 [Lachnoclostridium sp.]